MKPSSLVPTGPCVSGLMGLEMPKWSVFGDTGAARSFGFVLDEAF